MYLSSQTPGLLAEEGLKRTTDSGDWESEQRLIHALELVSIGFVLTDARLCIVHANEPAKSMMPVSKNKLQPGKPLVIAIYEAINKGDWVLEKTDIDAWLQSAAASKPQPITIPLRGWRWIRLEVCRTGEDGLVVTMMDVTDQRMRETKLAEISEQFKGEGEDLKHYARHLTEARAEATQALHRARAANDALAREVAERRSLEKELRRIANTDVLTSVLNRRRFIELMELELERAYMRNRPIALLMLDLDFFKRINDRFGHAAGDEALRRFARVCLDNLRDDDQFARLGGEEFAALLPETSQSAAVNVARRLRAAACELEFRHDDAVIKLTVSIGVTALQGTNANAVPETLLKRADRALYAAKLDGRDRVAHVSGDNEPKIDAQMVAYDS